MHQVRRAGCFTHRLAGLTLIALFQSSAPAFAQAWAPPAGTGAVTFFYQWIDNTGHLGTDGLLIPAGQSTNLGLYVEAEYAFTDRLSVTAGLPFVLAKYTDPLPGPPPIPYLPNEQCHCWNSGWQDVGFTARYNIVNGAFALTPFVSIGMPSHDYDFRGEAAIGYALREVRLGVSAGRRLDTVSPRLSVQGRYSYAIVEQVLGIPNNRSNASFDGGYAVTRRFSARGMISWQRTHGGLRFGADPPFEVVFPGEVNTPERLFQHDRLLRDNNLHAGASAAYAFPRMDLFGSYIEYISGTDSHAGRVFTMGVSWPFEISRKRP